MNGPFEKATETADRHGIDLCAGMARCAAYGLLESGPDWFLAGWFCRSSAPLTPADLADADCFFCWFLAGNLRKAVCRHEGVVDYLAWQRAVRGDSRIKIRPYPKLT